MIANSDATVVLVANSFNLSIFSQIWLLQNNILLEDEFGQDSIYTPAMINISSDKFELMILSERIQLKIPNNGDAADLVQRVIGGIVEKLPHTPYTALGLNFSHLLTVSDSQQIINATKNMFLCSNNPLSDDFSSADALFGGYLSKDMFDARFKLHINPVVVKNGKLSLLMNTNLHKDASNAEKIKLVLASWGDVHTYAQSLAEKMDSVIEV